MSDEKALLAAIWEHPHEDTPRLIYADWLQENGQEDRAEFIRLQCGLASLDEGDATKPALRERERLLWRQHKRVWTALLPDRLRSTPFHRGFPYPPMWDWSAEVFLSPETSAFLSHAPLWDVRILPAPGERLKQLSEARQLLRVAGLTTFVHDHECEALLANPYLQNLTRLDLSSSYLSRHSAEVLGGASSLPAEIHLAGRQITDDDAAVLASGPALRMVRSFNVTWCGFGERGFVALGTSAGARSWRRLCISGFLPGSGPKVSPAAVEAVVGTVGDNLRELDLSAWRIGDAGVRALCASQLRLHHLALYMSELTDAGLAELVNWPGLAEVRYLNLGANGFRHLGYEAILASPYLTRITNLQLHHGGSQPDRTMNDKLRKRFGRALILG